MVGPRGIRRGGGVRVQLPDSWHCNTSLTAAALHSTDPTLPNFVTARCNRRGAIGWIVEGGSESWTKLNRTAIDGRSGRYVYVTQVTVLDVDLVDGDWIEVIYGDRAGGSIGMRAALVSQGPEPVLVTVDRDGSGRFEAVDASDRPSIEVAAGEPAELCAIVPSVAGSGETATLRVVMLDRFGNVRELDPASVRVRAAGDAPDVEIDDAVRAPGQHAVAVPIRARGPGVVRLLVAVGAIETLTNPCLVEHEPSMRIYWGDLHAHAERSFDAIGVQPFEYARDVAMLDFFALTDHSERWPTDTFEWLVDQVRTHERDGAFVPILGYEATFGAPWGHHNVYFADLEGIVSGADRGTLLDLWAALGDSRALTVPHHTGVRFGGVPGDTVPGSPAPNPDWSYHDPVRRRLIEIYSGHGSSERYAPEDALSYENAGHDISTSAPGPHYAWDAWLAGHWLGVIASSDDHHGQPGRGEYGLAAVHAPRLDRSAVFDALWERRTYGTTGARIILGLWVNGCAMGGRVAVEAGKPAHVEVRVYGTGDLESVELLLGRPSGEGFEAVGRWSPAGADFTVRTEIRPQSAAVAYIRVLQKEPYRGRPVVAWSSPVWLDPSSNAGTAPSPAPLARPPSA
jgi:hypothetical protein